MKLVIKENKYYQTPYNNGHVSSLVHLVFGSFHFLSILLPVNGRAWFTIYLTGQHHRLIFRYLYFFKWCFHLWFVCWRTATKRLHALFEYVYVIQTQWWMLVLYGIIHKIKIKISFMANLIVVVQQVSQTHLKYNITVSPHLS